MRQATQFIGCVLPDRISLRGIGMNAEVRAALAEIVLIIEEEERLMVRKCMVRRAIQAALSRDAKSSIRNTISRISARLSRSFTRRKD